MPVGSIRKKKRRKNAPPETGPPKAAVAILVRADGKILCVLPQWAVSKKGKFLWVPPVVVQAVVLGIDADVVYLQLGLGKLHQQLAHLQRARWRPLR